MKKYLWLIIIIVMSMTNVKAATTLSINKDKIEVGDSFTIYVKMQGGAAWNIHATATGPVNNCVINQADASSDAQNVSKTFSTTCKATDEGTITITLSGDVTTQDDKTTILSGNKIVTVVKKGTLPKPAPTQSKSTNNKLKSLTIVGFTPKKIDDNNYTLNVDNSISSITINAVAEDEKATIKGNGSHNLVAGDNKITIIITSESGTQNAININVSRKEQATISDLDKLLSGSNNNIDISINNVTNISENILNSIKNSGKIVNLNYYDDNNKLVYTVVIDGKELNNITAFNPIISLSSNNAKELLQDANYAEGIILNYANSGKFPLGVKTRLFVGNKIQDNNLINIYEYNNSKFTLIKDKVLVKNGFIEVNLDKGSLYYVTLANLTNNVCNMDKTTNNSLLLIIISTLLVILLLFNVWYFLIRRNNRNYS